jgi:ABC-type antimicrobial peptide transport system permease subunit
VGVVVAIGVTRFMSKLLFQVQPLDPLTFVTTTIVLAAVGLMACWIPAARASRVDPSTSLRTE